MHQLLLLTSKLHFDFASLLEKFSLLIFENLTFGNILVNLVECFLLQVLVCSSDPCNIVQSFFPFDQLSLSSDELLILPN